MYILKIELNGKVYGLEVIKASAIKKMMAFNTKNNMLQAHAKATGEDVSEKIIDMMTEFLVSIFDNQFSEEELLDGLALSDLQPKFNEVIEAIMSAFDVDAKKK